jgi:hypothetical protein
MLPRSNSGGLSSLPAHLAASPQLPGKAVNRKLDKSLSAAANQPARLVPYVRNKPAGQTVQRSATSHLHQRPAQPRKHSLLFTIYNSCQLCLFLCFSVLIPKNSNKEKQKSIFVFLYLNF